MLNRIIAIALLLLPATLAFAQPATTLPEPVARALAQAGIPVLPEKVCATAREAVEAATAMGFPVVIKIASPDIAHKTEVGGVLLNREGDEAVAAGELRGTASPRAGRVRRHGDPRRRGR